MAGWSLHYEPLPPRETLRGLIIASLEKFLGASQVLDPELPCQGQPILALDRQHCPALICFHTSDANQALMEGLAAVDELTAQHHWVSRLYPSLSGERLAHELRLVVLAPSQPVGMSLLVATQARINVFTIRAVRVHHELTLLADMPGAPPGQLERRRPPSSPPAAANRPEGEVILSHEETLYFNHM